MPARKRAAEAVPVSEPTPQADLPSRSKPLVFISHDTRDAEIAESFSNLLTDASGGVLQSFRSSDRKGTAGIEFGTEWYSAIMDRLGLATDVVALLTEHSIGRPWILYEAGVAKGKLERTVFGLAVGVPLSQAIVGPFGQFQNSGDDEDSLTKLVLQLIRRNPEANPREEAVRRQVSVFRNETASILASRVQGPAEAESAPDNGAVAKLFEEVKAMVGQLPERLEGTVSTQLRRTSAARRRRLHPGFAEEMIYGARDGDAKEQITGLLVAATGVRDDLPWFYDLLTELHRAVIRGDRRTAETLFRSIMRVIDSGYIRYAIDEMANRDTEQIMHILLRMLPEVVERALVNMPPRFAAARRTEGQASLLPEPVVAKSTPKP